MHQMIDATAAKLFTQGAVGVIPTDTVYGLVARTSDSKAVTRLYQLKAREAKPGTLIAASVAQLEDLVLNSANLARAAAFWPGPVSVVLTIKPGLSYLDQAVGSLAVRIPANAKLRALLEATGPLLTSSANLPGQPPANSLAEAKAYFGDSVDFYLDGGDLSGRSPSTVIRFKDGKPQVLRPGAVTVIA